MAMHTHMYGCKLGHNNITDQVKHIIMSTITSEMSGVTLNDLRASTYAGPSACSRTLKFTNVVDSSDRPLPPNPIGKQYYGSMRLGTLRSHAYSAQAQYQSSAQVPFKLDLLRMARTGQMRGAGAGKCAAMLDIESNGMASVPAVHRVVVPGKIEGVVKKPMCKFMCEPDPGSLPAPVICRQQSVCSRRQSNYARLGQKCCGGR